MGRVGQIFLIFFDSEGVIIRHMIVFLGESFFEEKGVILVASSLSQRKKRLPAETLRRGASKYDEIRPKQGRGDGTNFSLTFRVFP